LAEGLTQLTFQMINKNPCLVTLQLMKIT